MHAQVSGASLNIERMSYRLWANQMNAEDFQRIFKYNRWVLHSFLETLEKLPPETVSENLEASHNSMRGIFTHILVVYDGWLNHAREGETSGVPESEFDQSLSIIGYHEAIHGTC